MIKEIFPDFEIAKTLEPEELAIFLLKLIDARGRSIHRNTMIMGIDHEMNAYTGDQQDLVFLRKSSEAWCWLENEILLAPAPGNSVADWFYVTDKGKRILADQDFTKYRSSKLLQSEGLDVAIIQKVKPLFIRGDYDLAIFAAFREVEERVRKKGGYTPTDLGTDLMRKSFNPNGGRLINTSLPAPEQEAQAHLFAGAIGLFKNPASHRVVDYNDPKQAADIIHFANLLLKIVG